MKITWGSLKSNSRAFLLASMVAAAAFWLWPSNVRAQMPQLRLTKSQQHVNDLAGVIDLATKQRLENILANLQQRTGIGFVIATIKTAGDQDLYDCSLSLARDWDVGSQTSKQKSLLLLLATDKARSYMLPSYSLRPDFPYGLYDEMSRSMRLQFQRSDFGGGLLAGIQTFISMLGERRGFTFATMDRGPAKLEAASATRPRQVESGPWPRNTITKKPLTAVPQSDVYLNSRQRSEARISTRLPQMAAVSVIGSDSSVVSSIGQSAEGQRVSVPQSARALGGVTVSGTVTDQAGAVIPKEKLRLTKSATGETRDAISDNSGVFTFNNIAPGEYTLTGQAEGFEPFNKAITMGTTAVTGVKVRMEISISEEVEVSARQSQPALAENNADVVNLNMSLLRALPTQSQEITPVLNNFLLPAAVSVKGPSIIIDGYEGNLVDIPTDSIRSLFINRNPYSAYYRRPGLSRVEITTRNGSRRYYEGSIAMFVRNSALDARNSFAVDKPHLDRRLFDGRLGGPLPFVKHAAFFLSLNRLVHNESVVVNALTLSGPLVENVPTSMRNTNFLGRLDVVPTKLHRISLIYNFRDQPERNVEVGGLNLREQGTSKDTRGHKFQIQDSFAVSERFLNAARVIFDLRQTRLGNRTSQPQIEVEGAFIGGPSQLARLQRENKIEFQDVGTYTLENQTFQFGGAFQLRFVRFNDASNFGGTFVFPTLAAFAAGRPISFAIVQGTPNVSFSQHQAWTFFQDEIMVNRELNLTLGLRYEWESRLPRHHSIAPRFALAFAPGKQTTVFRVGAGLFYDRLHEGALRRSLLIDGVHTRELIIDNPSFPNPFLAGELTPALPSVWRFASNLRAPSLFETSASVEHQFGRGTLLLAEYQMIRGVHLFRARNINAPLQNGGDPPNPDFGRINLLESSASLRTHALVVNFQSHITKIFEGVAQYTLSRTIDDTDGPFALPVNNFDLRPERGRSNLDRRQRFNFAGKFNLPWNMRAGAVLTFATGAPFNITTGFDDNGDDTVNDRPLGVTRNTGRGPGLAQVDLRFSKLFSIATPFKKKVRPGRDFRNLEISLDLFNAFNHTNFADIIGVLSSPRFGMSTRALPARTLQLSGRYRF